MVCFGKVIMSQLQYDVSKSLLIFSLPHTLLLAFHSVTSLSSHVRVDVCKVFNARTTLERFAILKGHMYLVK